TADLDSSCARRRPKPTVGAEEACGAVEQKKGRRSKKARKNALAFVAAIRERRNGLSSRTKKLENWVEGKKKACREFSALLPRPHTRFLDAGNGERLPALGRMARLGSAERGLAGPITEVDLPF